MRKAQGMPINTIIIAVIALIVLVVIILIFTGKISVFNQGADKCVGTCEPSPNCPGETGIIGYPMKSCGEGKFCCPPKTS